MSFILALVLATQADTIKQLDHKNPTVRAYACKTLAEMNVTASIERLIRLLEEEKVDEVIVAVVSALERLTDVKGNGNDPAKWRKWWVDTGSKAYPASNLDQIQQLVSTHVKKFEADLKDFERDVRILSITVGIIAVAFVLVMIYFVGHVSSKLKEWKELVKQAGVYIEESRQITKRTDRVLEELEIKKLEIMEFVKKLKEEKESEIERFVDLKQQNTEHKMREQVMELRQKAEKELQETLGQLRQQFDLEMHRVAGDRKEKFDKDFNAQHERFLKEVDAHTLFLEANFNHVNGKAEDALRLYKRIVVLKPDHQVAWEKMGNVNRDMMRYDEALEAYQKAIELDPNDPSAYYNMAATFARQRRRDKMLETLTRAIKNDGEFKDEALNDPAFREYYNDPAFKDLAEG